MKLYRLDSVGAVITAEGVTYPIVHWSWIGDSGAFRPRQQSQRGSGTMEAFYIEDGIRKAISYDADAAMHLSDIEPDGDWFNSLSDEDWATVRDIQNDRFARLSGAPEVN